MEVPFGGVFAQPFRILIIICRGLGQALFGTRAGLTGRVHPFFPPPICEFDPGLSCGYKEDALSLLISPHKPFISFAEEQSEYHNPRHFSETGIRHLVHPHHALHTAIPQSFEQHLALVKHNRT